MSEFHKYQHLERLGTTEVEGIQTGTVHVFPKLDGTNASVWLNEDGTIGAGSRNRTLAIGSDNAGFCEFANNCPKLKELFEGFPELRLFGEWLVPHSLKTYEDSAWRRFYVFDVMGEGGEYYTYDRYQAILEAYDIDYLSPIAIIKNGTDEQFRKCVEKNTVLIQEGQGIGEGVVLKNYDYVNKFGRIVWAKIITNGFKEVHNKAMGAPIIGGDAVEEKVVEKYITPHLVDKVYAKIENEQGGWSSKDIPKLLGIVWYDFITEEMADVLKVFKNPKLDFAFLQRLTTQRIKELRPDVF